MSTHQAGEKRCAAAVSRPVNFVWLGSYPLLGFFGYFGRYRVERLGWIRVYATSWKKERDGGAENGPGAVLPFPAEPQRFYEALRPGRLPVSWWADPSDV